MTRLEHLLGRYISLRQRSEQEVRRYLHEKRKKISVSDELVESLITKYTELGYIDDTKFVEAMTHSVITSKAKGRAFLSYRLQQAGVSKEEIATALSALPPEDVFSAMEKRLRKHESKLSHLESKERRLKAYSILYSSGFSSSEIRAFLDEWTEKG